MVSSRHCLISRASCLLPYLLDEVLQLMLPISVLFQVAERCAQPSACWSVHSDFTGNGLVTTKPTDMGHSAMPARVRDGHHGGRIETSGNTADLQWANAKHEPLKPPEASFCSQKADGCLPLRRSAFFCCFTLPYHLGAADCYRFVVTMTDGFEG